MTSLLEKFIILDDNLRNQIKWCIYRQLLSYRDKIAKTEDLKELADKIEKVCFNKTIETATLRNIDRTWECEEFNITYSIICGNVITKIGCNPDKLGFSNDEISFFVYEPIYRIDNGKTSNIQRIIADRQNTQTFKKILKVKCLNCGKEGATMNEQQKRSCDEPPTRRFECIHCGNFWFKG